MRKTRKELDTLDQLLDGVRADHPPETLAQCTIDAIERQLGFENSAVLLVDRATGQLDPIALSRQGGDDATLAAEFDLVNTAPCKVGEGVTGRVAKTGRPLLIADVRECEHYREMRSGLRSELCVPLVIGQRVSGVFNVESPKHATYRPRDQRLLQMLATPIAQAVEAMWAAEAARPIEVTFCEDCHQVWDERTKWRPLPSLMAEDRFEMLPTLCPDCTLRRYYD